MKVTLKRTLFLSLLVLVIAGLLTLGIAAEGPAFTYTTEAAPDTVMEDAVSLEDAITKAGVNGTVTTTAPIAVTTDTTVDGAGCTLTGYTSLPTLFDVQSGTLTLKNINIAAFGKAVTLSGADAAVVFENCTVTAADAVVYASGINGAVTVSGNSELTSENGDALRFQNATIALALQDTASVTAPNGTAVYVGGANVACTLNIGAGVTVTGKTQAVYISAGAAATELVIDSASAYKVTASGQYANTYASGNYATGYSFYTTFAAAMNAVNIGDMVNELDLLGDVSVAGTITPSRNIVINGNDYTLTKTDSGNTMYGQNKDITVNNLNIVSTANSSASTFIGLEGGNVVLNNVNATVNGYLVYFGNNLKGSLVLNHVTATSLQGRLLFRNNSGSTTLTPSDPTKYHFTLTINDSELTANNHWVMQLAHNTAASVTVEINNSTVTGLGGLYVYGVSDLIQSSLIVNHSTITASGSAGSNDKPTYAAILVGGFTKVTVKNDSTVLAPNTNAIHSVQNAVGCDITVQNSVIGTTADPVGSFGIYCYQANKDFDPIIRVENSSIVSKAICIKVNGSPAQTAYITVTMDELTEEPNLTSINDHGISFNWGCDAVVALTNVNIYAHGAAIYNTAHNDNKNQNNPKCVGGTIQNCILFSEDNAAIRLSTADNPVATVDLVVTDSTLTGRLSVLGLYALSGFESSAQFSNCMLTVTGDTNAAIQLTGTVDLKVTDCVIVSNKHGIYARDLDGGTITSIQVENTIFTTEARGIVCDADTVNNISLGDNVFLCTGGSLWLNGALGSTLNIYGGVYYNEVDHSTMSVSDEFVVNIYAGYFLSEGDFVIRSINYATVNIYGGYFQLLGDQSETTQSVIRQGTDTDEARSEINIYSGTFVAPENLPYVFCRNRGAGLNLYSFTAKGGLDLFSNNNGASTALPYPTEVKSYGLNTPVMNNGAQVRLTLTEGTNGGIRFVSKISADTLHLVKFFADKGSEISFGTLIVPADYLYDENEGAWMPFTFDMLYMMDVDYLNIKADKGLVKNADGSVTIRASISAIKEQNFGRAFAAVSYVAYQMNGKTVYMYSNFDSEQNVRSLKGLAEAALADVQSMQNAVYCFAVGDGTFSRYAENQRKALTKIVNCNLHLDEGASYPPTAENPGLEVWVCDSCGTRIEKIIPPTYDYGA